MLHRAMKRICPSLIFVARSKAARQRGGLMNGSRPSITSISANAPKSRLQRSVAAATDYFLADDGAAPEPPRIDWKKSLPASMTITSDLVRKLAR